MTTTTLPIYTASWYTQMPPGYTKIGISKGNPRGMKAGYRIFKTLAPGSWFNSLTPIEYTKRYRDEILGPLDPRKVVDDLHRIANLSIDLANVQDRQAPVVVCFEKPGQTTDVYWCHRAIVSWWLKEELDLDVFELGHDSDGCGVHHPMLTTLLRGNSRSLKEVGAA